MNPWEWVTERVWVRARRARTATNDLNIKIF